MKTKFSLIKSSAYLLIILFGLMIQTGFSQSSNNESPLPAPQGFVNDYAGVIDADTKQRLETRLKNFKAQNNPPVEIAVAVVATTGDRPIFDFSLAVARGWGIGSKNVDNPSALLLIAINDRKYFTQVSRDLEDELPDGLVGSLQRQYLVPEFKQGNYAKGIEDTIGAYISTIEAKQRGETIPGATPQTDKDIVDKAFDSIPTSVCRGFCFLIVIIFVIMLISGFFSGKGGGGRGGGSGGGGGQVAGAILGAILSGALSGGSSSGSSGSSSGWSGGGGGGGSDWGGFGGGGDFGGGGAGGDW